jgi:formylglycine-generating enzyme required for sulfatase activity
MDYLQTLEFRLVALQRTVRLLQDLRFFVDTASSEELAGFGEELKSVQTSSGASLGSVLAALLGSPGTAFPAGGRAAAPNGRPQEASPAAAALPPAGPRPPPNAAAASSASSGTDSGPALERPAAQAPEAEAPPAVPQATSENSGTGELLGLIEGAMKAIPAGIFVMGSEIDETEKPLHKVALHAFRISDHLVTNKEYSIFLSAHPEWSKDRAPEDLRDGNYLSDWGPNGFPEGRDEHPVCFVSFYAALALASWLGKRLPTEAEWEYAARGGLVGKKFPGGDAMNDKIANLAKQYRGTTPVRKFEPNGYGLYDMSGNLFEWTADWYAAYSPGESSNPAGPPDGEYKVVRGGSWMSGASALRVSARVDMEPQTCGQVGIRLADG